MDDQTRRRRQNDQPVSSGANGRYAANDPSSQRRSYGSSGASDRYSRPAHINTSPAGARNMGGTATYSGTYYQEPNPAFTTAIPPNTMAYQSAEYGQDARQTQNFNTYPPSMMYNVPQATTYDTNQQFQPRQAAGIQMMPTDVAAPYFANEPGTSSALQHGSSSASAAVYQQSPTDQRSMVPNYSGGVPSMGSMSAQTNAPEQAMDEQDFSSAQPSNAMGEAYEQYQSALREVFSSIHTGGLKSASESLLNISNWLLGKTVDLGLAADNPTLHQDRIKMWKEFNYAWLGLFQRQKDFMVSSETLNRSQNLMSEEDIIHLGKEIVKLCDGIERHGLVDYEYGVWEEDILAVADECLDLYENADKAAPTASSSRQNSHR